MSIVQKDISNLESQPELPDTYLKEGDFLRVKTDGSGDTEWFDTNTGSVVIGTALVGDGTVSTPSFAFQSDTNTGIYRLGEDDIGITSGGVTRMALNGTSIQTGTITNPLPFIINGSLTTQSDTITTGSYSWNNLTSDAYNCNSVGGNIVINLQFAGTENLGRKILFYKSNTSNELRFFASGGTVRVNSPLGTQAQPNAGQFTNIPVANGFLCIYEIIRESASNYSLQILEYQNNTDTITFGQIFRAGDGVGGTPSYSFANTTGGIPQGADTGMFYVYDIIDRLRFSAGGSNTLEMNANQSFFNNRLLANSTGTNTTPSLIFHNDSSTTGYSGQRTNPSTDPRLWAVVNGVQATELTPTQFNIGLNTLNNINMKTLNQNGASNFNSFTPTYTNIINTQVTSGRTDGNFYGIDYNPTTGVYIVGSSSVGAGVNRIAVSGSNNLTSWTTYNDTTLNLGNIRHVAYGPTPNIWVVGTQSLTTGNFFYSSDTINWTRLTSGPFTTSRQYSRLKWINGQFVALSSSSASIVIYSNDGINWFSITINATSYSLNDITYSSELRMYVITTTSAAVLYFNDTSGTGITASTTFTAQTSNVYASNAVAWSPKLSMFIIQSLGSATQWISSSDGINWRTYTTSSLNAVNSRIEWVSDFGGLFVACQAATNANSIVSRDGMTWSQINLTISGQTRGFYYNSSQKVFVFGLDGNLTFKNALTDFNNYVDSDLIYNTFNSNIRFGDVIEYQNQVLTPVSGNNHFTISQFNRPEVVFDTASVNANIYLQGTSFNGRVGTKFKFIKSNNNNNVRIHGFETTTLISPTGNVSSFNAQSSPVVYSIIPNGYFGSFELTRISDIGNGVWIIDNVDLYNSSGTSFNNGNLIVNNNLTTYGTLSVDSPGQTSTINHNLEISGYLRYPIEDIKDITFNTGYDVKLPNMLSLGKYNYFISAGSTPSIYLQNINSQVYDNFTFNFCIAENGTTSTNYQIQNDMGGSHIVKVYKNGVITTLTATQTTTIDMHQWTRCTYKHNYRSGNNYWLVHHYNSSA